MNARTALRALSTLLAVATAGCASQPATPPAPAPAATTESPTPSQPAAVDITKPPELAPPPTRDLPPLVTRKLGNGLSLLIVEQHELPVADFIMLVHTGGEADPSQL